jgi:molybdate/tungstate transport system substrate-binding protein
VKLPPEIDLSAPEFAARYGTAEASLSQLAGRPPLVLRGAPIVFALTVPTGAAQPALALEFVRYLLSAEGGAVLRRSGFSPLQVPEFVGETPAKLQELRAGTG